MLYMTPDNCNLLKDHDKTFWGQIITPSSFMNAPALPVWCGDNEAYTGRFEPVRFIRWLWKMRRYRHTCKFVTAPDKVSRAGITLLLYLPSLEAGQWLPSGYG